MPGTPLVLRFPLDESPCTAFVVTEDGKDYRVERIGG